MGGFNLNKLDLIPDQKYIFGGIQIAANQMDTLMERELKEHNLTTKQWLLCVVIQNSFDHAPTIKELAAGMGSSHQNVKQVALRLQEKGFALKDAEYKLLRLYQADRYGLYWQLLWLYLSSFTSFVFLVIISSNPAILHAEAF